MTGELWLERLSWPQVERLLEAGWDRAIVPVGATEQHGPHMGLRIDSLHTAAVAEEVARRLGRTLVAPLLSVGCSEHHMAFPGTLTVSTATLRALLLDVCGSLAHHGFGHVLVVSGHGGNHAPLAEIEPDLVEAVPGAIVYADGPGFMSGLTEIAAGLGVPAAVAGWHAGELETSLALALDPGLVDTGRLEPGHLTNDPGVLAAIGAHGIQAVARNGVLGDPTAADAARGAHYLEGYVALVHRFFAGRLEEGRG
jgi:creatinine amidohydrolase